MQAELVTNMLVIRHACVYCFSQLSRGRWLRRPFPVCGNWRQITSDV